MEPLKTFEGLNPGDLVVSIKDCGSASLRYEGDIIRVTRVQTPNTLRYRSNTTSCNPGSWRLLTEQERKWHLTFPEKNTNINNMPKSMIVESYPIY